MIRLAKLSSFAFMLGALAAAPAGATSPTGETRPIPSTLLPTVGGILPEHSEIGAAFLSSAFDPNMTVTEPATIRVTFLSEGAGFLNTLGWFSFTQMDAGIQILERGLVFPNASFADPKLGWGGGNLATGDAVTIQDSNGQPKVFQPGVRVGFFIVANGWNGHSVTGWNVANHPIPNVDPTQNVVASGVFTTIDALNPEVTTGHPELSRHCAVLKIEGLNQASLPNPLYLMSFEDLRRDQNADNDFNDVVFMTEASPEMAVQSTPLTYDASSPDPDGDGVSGLHDAFPDDSSRASIQSTPPVGVNTLAFEDNYPLSGDRDFNDAVLQYAIDEVLTASGSIKDIVGTFHLVARGAGYDHSFGISIPLPASIPTGTVTVERFTYDGIKSPPATTPLASLVVAGAGGNTLRITDLFASTRAALPPATGLYTNTTNPTPERAPASVRFKVTFDVPVGRSTLGTAPFDPYLAVVHDLGKYDIHLPGKPGFPDRLASLPVETGPRSFIDSTGAPFALAVPWNFQFPLEGMAIESSFPRFESWRTSAGAQNPTWYQSPWSGTGNRVTNPVTDAVRSRAWTIQAVTQ